MKSLENTLTQKQAKAGFVDTFLRNGIISKLSSLRTGKLIVADALGQWQAGEPDHPDPVQITVHDLDFYKRLVFGGSNAIAVAYMEGLWSCNQLTELFRLLLRNEQELDQLESGTSALANVIYRAMHSLRKNSKQGSRQNIHAHYDLGNDLFQLFLDRTMTYSSGIYSTADATLEQASIEKLDRVCRKLGLTEATRVIEVGSGWGSFALHAAMYYGCHVTTTTISDEQFEYVQQRVHEHGLSDRITLLKQDYRTLTGQYDRLVSIEMIEAVGHRYLPDYFRQCASLLKNDGQMLIQAITMPEHRYQDYLKRSDFIQQFIFPGSCCPAFSAITSAAAHASDLNVAHVEDIGPHYARTLRDWRTNFNANRQQILQLDYDENFMRLWNYYLCYCEAGFSEHYTGDLQIVFDKPGCRSSVEY